MTKPLHPTLTPREILQKIYDRVGFETFRYTDVVDIVDSAQSLKKLHGLNLVARKENGYENGHMVRYWAIAEKGKLLIGKREGV